MIKSLKDESFNNGLKRFHLKTTEMRRLWGDLLLEIFKMFKGMDNLYYRKFLKR